MMKVLLKRITLISFLICWAFGLVSGQNTQPRKSLTEITADRTSYNTSQMERATAYAKAHNVPMTFRDHNGNYVYMIGVDESGFPIYRTTLNAGAAITTGVPALRTGGSLGLNLEGDGMVVGVWDNGLVKDHAEFGNRLLTRQGTELSDHSTHVTGTMIAAGLQPEAKGMAPKAMATTWDFNNDDAEMASLARPDQTSLLFSNHSYGIVLGFLNSQTGWSWTGNSSISTNEDYRFGFYSSKSRTIDQIAFNAPYYTIVWAAGNDRADTGDGTHPPDGNGGTGYDCIGPEGVAKNNITVGAVLKVPDYTGPSSVVMSNFSSWGPTDDGRIKPDLVGAGVSVYSTSVTSDGQDSYMFLQGTSMSTPNVTGSLVLLQQLYRDLHAGNFMKAATVKALAIHTAKEAGPNPGPDYSFGWGLLDVEAAAKVLLAQDQESVVVLENTLLNNEVFDFEFEPLNNTKITATIAWTDPPGNPASPQVDPTTPMLVNDLDIKIFDAGGNEVLPWTLNPGNPSGAATKGNNVRDNVEKIEFDLPEPRLYTLRVSHKGQLQNNIQDYSLILTYTPSNDPKTAYYWIGNSGNWNNLANWSLTSGGPPANVVPDNNGRVVIDENSFSAGGQTIALTADAACASITWLAKTASSLSLNNHKLTIDGNLVASSNQLSVSTAGQIELVGSSTSQNQLNLNNNDFSKADIYINSANGSSWTVNGKINAGSIIVQQGGLIARGTALKLKKLDALSPAAKVIDISNTMISDVSESTLNGASLSLTSSGSSINLVNSGVATVTWTGINYDGSLDTKGSQVTLSGGTTINNIIIGGSITLNNNNAFDQFAASAGSSISLQNGSVQNLTSKVTLDAQAANRIAVNVAGAGTAQLNFTGHFKHCFDYLDVSDVGLSGDATISAGNNSTLVNASNWVPGACGDALFADFSFKFNCVGALTEFSDGSDGNITSWSWDFGDPASGANTSNDQYPLHTYGSANTFTATVTVSDGNQSVSYSKDVTVMNNNLPSNRVIIANQKLFSELTAEFYQWYKNGQMLDSETARSYEFNGDPGSYFVVIKNGTCNLPSSTFLISAVDAPDVVSETLVYPNPATTEFTIEMPRKSLPASMTITNPLGLQVYSSTLNEPRTVIGTGNLKEGIYFLDIFSPEPVRKKILIRR
jgi:PKD repeat protein